MKPIKFVRMVSILGAALGFSTMLFAQEFTPFKSKDAGTFTVSSTNTPGVVLTQDTATGEGTRVGRYKLVASELIRLSDLSITNGHYTLTAADGSTLSGAYEGHGSATSMPGVISWDVCGPLTSGTGRFANATGAICFFGTGNLATGLFSEISVGLLTSTIDDSDGH